MKRLTIVRKIDLLRALLRLERDDKWIKARELEVHEGLRREKENGYPGRGVYAR